MPVELEYKFILAEDPNYEARLIKYLSDNKIPYNIHEMEQCYLKGGGRVRALRTNNTNNMTYEFCYKEPIKKGEGNIEFELPISEKDFILSKKVSDVILTKNRYKIVLDNFVWEVDIFLNKGESYFNLVEVEFTKEGIEPSTNNLPSIIKNNIILKTLDDDRFTSKKLANVKYAKKLYKNI